MGDHLAGNRRGIVRGIIVMTKLSLRSRLEEATCVCGNLCQFAS